MRSLGKKFLSVLLSLIIIFGIVISGGGFIKSYAITAYEVLDKLNALDQNGYYVNNYGNLKPGTKGLPVNCWKYVLQLSKYLFGSDVTIPSSGGGNYNYIKGTTLGSFYRVEAALTNCSYDQIITLLKKSQPGDLIGFYNSGADQTDGHIMLIGNNTGSKLTVYQSYHGEAFKHTADLTVNGLKNLPSFGYNGGANFNSSNYGISLFRCNKRTGQSDFVYTDEPSAPPPAVTSINGLKSTYAVGETLSVSWPVASGATSYRITVLKKDISGDYIYYYNSETAEFYSYSFVLNEIGDYAVFILSLNSAGKAEGTWHYFNVVSSVPQSVDTIHGIKTVYTVGETLSVSWSPVNGATSYRIAVLKKDSCGDYIFYNNSEIADFYSYSLILNEIGEYYVFIRTFSSSGNAEGARFYFNVVCSNHIPGIYQYTDYNHPHYKYYSCSQCGAIFNSYETSYDSSCSVCNPTYTLSYDANGGTGAPSAQTGNGYINISSIRPTHADVPISATEKYFYTFAGWSTSPGATYAQYQPGESINLANNTILYAVWTVGREVFFYEQFTLVYDANGGINPPSSQTGNGTINLSSVKPTKSGYTFLGWATNSSATSAQYQPGASFNLTADTILYAVWKSVNYTVTYNANGGTGAPPPQSTATGSLTLSTVRPTRSGYEFLGWAENPSATEPKLRSGANCTVSGNATLYAIWKLLPESDSLANAKLNYKTSETVDYRSKVTVTFTATGVPTGYHIVIVEEINGKGTIIASGDNRSASVYLGEVTSARKIFAWIVSDTGNGAAIRDANGQIIGGMTTVNVNTGFFAKIIAFFKGLFGLLPNVEIKP